MAHPSPYLDHDVAREDRADGTVLLRSRHRLPEVAPKTGAWLHRWADERPETVFLAERSGAGWRAVSYAEALDQVRALAAGLLARGLGNDRPILILSGNGVDHGLLSLAAHYVGIPTVPVAEQYSLIPGAQKQLDHILALTDPGMVYAVDGARFGSALALDGIAGRDIVVSVNPAPGQALLSDLTAPTGVDVDAAAAQVGPDSVVKILMTSGSTSSPKGVITTHRMMCVNQAQYQAALPFLNDFPLRLVDWLPWNHVFGGSSNFNQVLANGGSLYIDDDKPARGLIDRTIENILLMNPTVAYNVPVGFTLLRDEMRRNRALQEQYFRDLNMIFYAGASMPRDVWDDLVAMAVEVRGDPPLMTTSWGLTETAPACILQHHPTERPGILGVPLAEVVTKLVPEEGDRFEVRVKGPNVMPGYFRDPARTADAFDDEGFFITGDAMTLVDPGDVNRGLRFDGRISEDFKLQTGTWVRAAAMRLDLLVALAPLVSDVVIAGEGRSEVGLLILPAPAELARDGVQIEAGVLRAPALAAELRARLEQFGQNGQGSSGRVRRALILAEPASMAEGEITAKGNLNFRKLLLRRADLVERLFSAQDPEVIAI